MSYFYTKKLIYPLKKYQVNSYKFGQDCWYDNIFWGKHLGEDINRKVGTVVRSIGRGRVVYSKLVAKRGKKKNWGNIIAIAHKNPHTKQVFYSLYAHLGARFVSKGEKVHLGQRIGTIGKRKTIENGWWNESHLHFSIYRGPWDNKKKILPGYFRKDQNLTKTKFWLKPSEFIKNY
jgi:murein DD-endopeptidase MepM/ murein hydrolase activator NlpD